MNESHLWKWIKLKEENFLHCLFTCCVLRFCPIRFQLVSLIFSGIQTFPDCQQAGQLLAKLAQQTSRHHGSSMLPWQNQLNDLCVHRRLRSAWASAWSDQSVHCLQEDALGSLLPIKCTAKTLIRLGGCPGWSESSLGAHANLLVLSCSGSVWLEAEGRFC